MDLHRVLRTSGAEKLRACEKHTQNSFNKRAYIDWSFISFIHMSHIFSALLVPSNAVRIEAAREKDVSMLRLQDDILDALVEVFPCKVMCDFEKRFAKETRAEKQNCGRHSLRNLWKVSQ